LLFSDESEDAVLKVIDFGFARLLSDESKALTTPCFTLAYAAPEVLPTRHSHGYTEACDLWSIGVILVSG
jgi:serine/threonine protein kinase